MTTNNEIQNYDQNDNSFINKLLGEMKNKFNKPGSIEECNSTIEESKDNSNNQDCVEIVKTENVSSSESPGRRSHRQKGPVPGQNKEESLKRSSRRRSTAKESVLQNAIARKVKSYNESSKPQRLTRQLRPTQKVLENIAQAKDIKRVKMKVTDGGAHNNHWNEGHSKKNSAFMKRNQKNVKQLKTSDTDKETESNDSYSKDDLELDTKNVKQLKRISTSLSEETSPDSKHQNDDQVGDIRNHSSILTNENPELASRLCLCTQKTNVYRISNNDDVVYCSAVDSIDERLIGCSREVNVMVSPLLRPSRTVPYLSLCELHKNRMIRHNCCPTCGVFCTQGKFAQCEAKHQFHRKCRLSVSNRDGCPHCGMSTAPRDVLIKFQCSNSPVFLPIQKSKCT